MSLPPAPALLAAGGLGSCNDKVFPKALSALPPVGGCSQPGAALGSSQEQ